MKTTGTSADRKISSEELEKITKEVKETLAFGYLNQNKIFSSAQLWNIQRRRKHILSRR